MVSTKRESGSLPGGLEKRNLILKLVVHNEDTLKRKSRIQKYTKHDEKHAENLRGNRY